MHSPFPLLCQTTLHQIASHCCKYLSKHTADIGFWLVPRNLWSERQVYLTGPPGEWSLILCWGLEKVTAGSQRLLVFQSAHILTWLITTVAVDGIILLTTLWVWDSNWSWHNSLSFAELIRKKGRNKEMRGKNKFLMKLTLCQYIQSVFESLIVFYAIVKGGCFVWLSSTSGQ